MFLDDLFESLNIPVTDHLANRVLFPSKAVCADVNGAVNPNWQEVHEKQNACYLGAGICVTKFTGHGGKVGANDAHAEYVAEIRRLLRQEKALSGRQESWEKLMRGEVER